MPPTWLPTAAELGGLMSGVASVDSNRDAANADGFSEVRHTLNTTTVVSEAAGTQAIQRNAAEAEAIVGPEDPDATPTKPAARLLPFAKNVVLYRAAADLSEKHDPDREPYFSKRADAWLELLRGEAADVAGGDEQGPDDNTSGFIRARFPASQLVDSCGYPRVL